jgi:NADH:ubiquinone oxidoreductase subunit 6 (subunit J)
VSAVALSLVGLALLFALAAILLGRNLTRAVMAGYASIGLMGLALTLSGLGFAAIAMTVIATIALACIQVFGWMLVDVDRDHLRPTDGPTWLARILAFGLLGGGLGLLMQRMLPLLEEADGQSVPSPSVTSIGVLLFGELGGATILLGCAMAAALLAAMLLLRGTGEGG